MVESNELARATLLAITRKMCDEWNGRAHQRNILFHARRKTCTLKMVSELTTHIRITRALWLAIPLLTLLGLLAARPSVAQPHAAHAQGCVNQGNDRRVAGWAVCFAQRHLSWKSQRKPHFFLIGKSTHTSLGVAWPPYVVYNSPKKKGHWRMFRLGFRYDRNWHGYIFPTAAWKVVSTPLEY